MSSAVRYWLLTEPRSLTCAQSVRAQTESPVGDVQAPGPQSKGRRHEQPALQQAAGATDSSGVADRWGTVDGGRGGERPPLQRRHRRLTAPAGRASGAGRCPCMSNQLFQAPLPKCIHHWHDPCTADAMPAEPALGQVTSPHGRARALMCSLCRWGSPQPRHWSSDGNAELTHAAGQVSRRGTPHRRAGRAR